MRLYDIVRPEERGGIADCEIGTITDDTRKLASGDIFIAITGRNFDGHSACEEMLQKGAAAVVVERDLGLPQQIIVPNSRVYYSVLASRYYGEPTRRLKLIAVTGTNGKTTTASMIQQLMERMGHRCGYIGTARYDVCGKTYEAHLTTPYQMDLYRYFYEMAENGAEYCAMEASSQALSQFRFTGEHFVCGIFTNLTQDHLDWHGTMENYYRAKKSLFACCDSAVINIDDEWGKRLYDELETANIRRVTVSVEQTADFYAAKPELSAGGVDYWLACAPEEQAYRVKFPMPGKFNVENSLCAAAACECAGFPIRGICGAFSALTGVCGRAEVLYDGDYTVICDYAHTEDALEKILSAMKGFVKGRMMIVFGAAGERDAGKRKAMGQCVARYCDIAVVTSDNPRFEDPESIIKMVLEGFEGESCEVHSFIDRLEAIKFAVKNARVGDVLLLCGKGHENYQVIGADYLPFSEHEIIRELCCR